MRTEERKIKRLSLTWMSYESVLDENYVTVDGQNPAPVWNF